MLKCMLALSLALPLYGNCQSYAPALLSDQAVLATSDKAISGPVKDPAGHPLADATVMVYHAGPQNGYSLFCPSCYIDCGKRARTDRNGVFVFNGLKSDLWFELLVAKNGYRPKFIEKAVPSIGPYVSATLEVRHAVSDPRRVFRGQVVDDQKLPQANAVVQPIGGMWNVKDGAMSIGPIPGLEPIAITDSRGFFEIDALPSDQKPGLPPPMTGPPSRILVSVDVRGMSQKFNAISSGQQVHPVTVNAGATVRGRLIQDGKPVSGAELGIIGSPHGGWGAGLKMMGNAYDEIRIGTRPDGRFEIDNVPIPGTRNVYSKMESVGQRGATGTVRCTTTRDDEIVELGDLELKPAFQVRGRVLLSDNKPIPDGMRVTISAEDAWDTQTALLSSDGRFEFKGIAAGKYSVLASVRGYSAPPIRLVTETEKDGRVVTYTPPPPPLVISQDVNDLAIRLEPDGTTSRTSAQK